MPMPSRLRTPQGRRRAAGFLILLCLVSLPLSCLAGPADISAADVLAALLGQDVSSTAELVVLRIRLPRSCVALLCGGALAAAGVTLQGVLRNPLADSFTLGVSAGAACGASAAIAFGGPAAADLGLSMTALVSAGAMIGAMTALACTLALGSGGGFAREDVVLAGIATAAFLGALVAMIKALNEESVTSIVFWIMGSLQGRGWKDMPILLATFVPGAVCMFLGRRALDVLGLGDEQAAQTGLDVARARLLLLAGASCMTAGCVAVAGVIGFVGLVAPHILRLCLGVASGPLLFGGFFGGGLLLLWADVAARSVLSEGREVPVGVVTALLGGPFFALLVRRRRG